MSSTTEAITRTSTSTSTSTTERRHASSRRDPATAALVILVAAAVLLRPAAAAPMSKELAAGFDTWWYNACGHHGMHNPSHHNNHNDNCELGDVVPNRSKNQVRRQMKIFLGSFRKELQSINKIYAKVMTGFTAYSQPAYDWLPKFKKPANHNKSKVILRDYHSDLQKYVVAVHYLATLNLETEAEFQWQKNRTILLTNLSNNMKGLLCEIETAVNATCQTVPKRIPVSFAYDHGLNPKLHDLTKFYLQDWGVLKCFENFMNKSKRLVSYLPPHKGKNKGKPNKQTQQKHNQNSNKKTTKPPKSHNKDNKKSKSKSPT